MSNNTIYLTPTLYLKDNQLYNEDNDKIIKLNNRNWHHYLNEYGYEKLELGWRKRLKSLKSNNSLWGVMDCGGEGDCLFLCIEEAYKNFYNPTDDDFSVLNLRNMAAEKINENNFDFILENYKLEKQHGEFDGNWDPYSVKNIDDLKDKIKISGDTFWGDHIIIQLLEEALNINIIILNCENDFFLKKAFKIQSTGSNFDTSRRTVIISYCLNSHFQLIGYFNGNKMQTIFNNEELPTEMKKVYMEDIGKVI